MENYIIAHDLGTSGDKATLFTTDGTLIASQTKSYEVQFFGDNCAEQNPEDWWQAVCETTKELLKYVDKKKVIALSFSGQMQGCLVVDKGGIPLRPGIIWADHRSKVEADILEDALGADYIYQLTGHRVSPSYSIEKLMWIKKHEPEIYEKTYKMLQAKDYIIYRLTGEFVTDYSDASGTNAFDLKEMCWSKEILKVAGINEDKLPKIGYSTDIVGTVTKEASLECGLGIDTQIVCGGGDGPCSAVGAGCIEENEWFTTFGTSAWIGGTTKEPFKDDEKIAFCFAHVIPNHYMPCGTMQAAGSSYSYLRDNLFFEYTYEALDKMIIKSPVGAKKLFFLPYLLGERSPRWNSNASASFIGINPNHGKEDYVRATIEGIAYNLELILQTYRKKYDIHQMTLTGGGAQSDIICQILSEVLNVTFLRPSNTKEATSIGAALIAGVGVGVFDGFEDIKKFMDFDTKVVPVKSHVDVYQNYRDIFNDIYMALLPVYEKLND